MRRLVFAATLVLLTFSLGCGQEKPDSQEVTLPTSVNDYVMTGTLVFGGPLHTTMPPGYELTCDGKGHYMPRAIAAPGMPDACGMDLYSYGVPGTIDGAFTNKQDAIERAWRQYEYIPNPVEFTNRCWPVCSVEKSGKVP